MAKNKARNVFLVNHTCKNLQIISTGVLIAVFLIYGAGMICLTSPTIFKFDSDLGFANRCAGFFKQQRNENWVSFGYGKYSLEFSATGN